MYEYVFQFLNELKSWEFTEGAVLLEKIFVDPLAGLLWKRQLESIDLNLVGKKFRIGNDFSFIEYSG